MHDRYADLLCQPDSSDGRSLLQRKYNNGLVQGLARKLIDILPTPPLISKCVNFFFKKSGICPDLTDADRQRYTDRVSLRNSENWFSQLPDKMASRTWP